MKAARAKKSRTGDESEKGESKKALVVVQCFPPLLKNAGGVSKRYLTLCRALIDGLGWQVTLLTPVNVSCSREEDVARWLKEGSLIHVPARGVRISSSTDGVAVFLDLISFVNAGFLLKELCIRRCYDCVFTDDVPWRLELLLLARAMGVPSVVSTHTDITHMKSFKGTVKIAWNVHMLSSRIAAIHATVSNVFGQQLSRMYGVPVGAVWPPILWSGEFRGEPSEWAERAASQRGLWLEQLKKQGCVPKAILLFAGRWSAEKRIHLLYDAVPKDCALVIVGDGTSDYARAVADSGPASGRPNVLALRRMLNARDLRLAYAASDLFLSASNFETLGNTVIEALCSGTPCALQPAQGHLEFVQDGKNSWFVDYDDQHEAKVVLSRIVASGLAKDSLRIVLPEFEPMGATFRGADFPRDFEKAVIAPALAFGREQGGPVEAVKRVLAFMLCIFLWFTLRFFTRISFVLLRDPEFEVLGPLGGAVDDKRSPTILTFPCLRPFFGSSHGSNGAANGQEHGATDGSLDQPLVSRQMTEPDGTDYASHYEPARKPWWNRRL